jgi:hypothetical protein
MPLKCKELTIAMGKIWERYLVAGMSAKSHRINGPCVFVCAHNPKVVSSNLTPATNSNTDKPGTGARLFLFCYLVCLEKVYTLVYIYLRGRAWP